MLYKKLKIKIQMWYFFTINIKNVLENRESKIDGVVMGIYSGWGSFLLKYGGEVFLDGSIFCMISY